LLLLLLLLLPLWLLLLLLLLAVLFLLVIGSSRIRVAAARLATRSTVVIIVFKIEIIDALTQHISHGFGQAGFTLEDDGKTIFGIVHGNVWNFGLEFFQVHFFFKFSRTIIVKAIIIRVVLIIVAVTVISIDQLVQHDASLLFVVSHLVANDLVVILVFISRRGSVVTWNGRGKQGGCS